MKVFLFVLLAAAGFAQAAETDYSTIVRCEKYEGNGVVIVKIERKVVDLYTPRARFVDRLVSEYRIIDPGSATPWISGLVTSDINTKTGDMTYKGRGFSLQVARDYSTMTPINNAGSYTLQGQGTLTSTNDRGSVETTELSCISYEEM